MSTRYVVQFEITNTGRNITLKNVKPNSDYVKTLFNDSSLLREVDIEEDGQYRLHIIISEDGYITPLCVQKYVGWDLIDESEWRSE